MSIMSEISRISQNISGAMTAIANKGVTVPAGSTSDDLADLISEIETGVGSAGESGALFIDYDGTELYSYTTAQALALSALPANPTHTGLTAQGWNWTLAEIKAYLTKYPDAMVVVGQMYITDDGKTRIYIHLEEERKEPKLGLAVDGTVDVDWGDGTTHDMLTGTDFELKFTSQHKYASGGDYVIQLTVTGEAAISGETSANTNSYLLVNYNGSNAINGYYQNAIKKIEIGANIQYLRDAFRVCASLSNITIPRTTMVYGSTFFNCQNLASVTIPNGITEIGTFIFSSCFILKNVSIPAGITSIGDYAFNNCTIIKNITIPDSVISIGNYAFQYCYNLESINIPNGVTRIGDYVFASCYRIKNTKIPDNVTSIGNYAFSDCYSLIDITIPEDVVTIGASAFANCRNITSINIPEGITTINFLSGCQAIKNIVIPNNITSIGEYAFRACYSLTDITIPNSVTSIGNYAFNSCYSLTNITIPNNVTSIGNYAFAYCYNLQSIYIPNSVTTIGSYAFEYCISLTSVHLPNSITAIPSYLFGYCYNLSKITIPAGVTKVNNSVFYNCYAMAEYHFLPTTPPTLTNINVLQNIPSDCIIYVPYSADHSILAAYQAATNWSTYASQIQEEPQ